MSIPAGSRLGKTLHAEITPCADNENSFDVKVSTCFRGVRGERGIRKATIALSPDLVVAVPSPGNRETVRAIERAGIRVLVVHDRTLAELWGSIRGIAGALGLPAAGERLVADVTRRLEAVRARVADLPPRRVL